MLIVGLLLVFAAGLIVSLAVRDACGRDARPSPPSVSNTICIDGRAYVVRFPEGRLPMTDAERVCLEGTCKAIVEAYRNGDVSELRACFATLQGLAGAIQEKEFEQVYRPVEELVVEVFGKTLDTRLFESPLQFERFAERAMLVGLSYGRIALVRREYSARLIWIESRLYALFSGFAKGFAASGRRESAVMAERYLDQVIEQIESPEGYSRLYLHVQKWLLRFKDYTTCSEDARILDQESVLAQAEPLRDVGYAPKWLVEFEPVDWMHTGRFVFMIDPTVSRTCAAPGGIEGVMQGKAHSEDFKSEFMRRNVLNRSTLHWRRFDFEKWIGDVRIVRLDDEGAFELTLCCGGTQRLADMMAERLAMELSADCIPTR